MLWLGDRVKTPDQIADEVIDSFTWNRFGMAIISDVALADRIAAAIESDREQRDESDVAFEEVLWELDDLADSIDEHVTTGDIHDALTMLTIRMRNGWFND